MNSYLMVINMFCLLAAAPSAVYASRQTECKSGLIQENRIQDHELIANPVIRYCLSKSPVAESSMIRGRVTENNSGLPVQHVIIRWKGTAESAITDAEGIFRLNMQPGQKKLLVSKPGWIEKSMTFRKNKILRVRKRGIGTIDMEIQIMKSQPGFVPEHTEEDLPIN